MYRADFVGRRRELEVLDRLWDSNRATLLILYGRRRVGKTRLLTHWLRQRPEQGLYWVAEPASLLTQLRSFSQALMSFMDPEAEVPADFSFSTWELALRQVANFAQGRRVALFIDEVTYLIDVDPGFVGTLQKIWDRWLSESNVMLVLSGSQMGLMQKHLLQYEAPLYGRATAHIQLPPLPYGTTSDYFPDYGPADRVAVYGMWGGVPAYWERLDPRQSVLENFRLNVLPAHAWMVDESRILLQDFITDMHNYVGILRAVANEQQTMGEISQRTGLDSSKASFYLSVLRDTGFVRRDVPISQRGRDSRRGRYVVTDPYLRFFYHFISAHQSKLALGQSGPVMQQLEESLPAFLERNTWLEMCRDWTLLAAGHGALPAAVDEVGAEWASSYEVDVVGIGEETQSLVLGDCYWRAEPLGLEAVEALVKKTAHLIPKQGDEWRVHYVLFSAAGWTEAAAARAEWLATTSATARGRQRWRPEGVRLVDLATVDRDLTEWAI
ncbi:ATP-binding protein [Promineifilum sp.]|uniref:ATP-binding protein n=1 Tax=Promineifilum sp. TaxID=2664178 RepID=UPI0035B419A2